VFKKGPLWPFFLCPGNRDWQVAMIASSEPLARQWPQKNGIRWALSFGGCEPRPIVGQVRGVLMEDESLFSGLTGF